ncbi:MAG: MFS transporter [Parasphingorhabdus sp.]
MEATSQPRLTNKWIVLLLLLGISVFNYGDRYLLAGLVEPIKAEFSVSDGFMGLLLGPAFAVFYSILAIPFAIYADRHSRINIICAGCVIWSLFTVLGGFADSQYTLAAARVGVGVGEAAFQAPAFSLIASYFKPEQRGKAFAVMALSVYIGQILGYSGGPAIAAQSDWRMAFIVMGSAGFVVVALAWLLVKEPPHEKTSVKHPPLFDTFRQLIRVSSYRYMAIGMGLGVMSGIAFGFWGPTLFSRAYDMSQTEAGSAFGVAFTIPAFLGVIGFGALVDYLTKNGYGRALMLSAIALLFATLSIMGAIWASSVDHAVLWAIPAGLLGGGWSVGLYASLQYILPDRMRATGTALAMLIVNILGFVLGPWIAGGISDYFGADATGIRQGLTVVVPVGIVGALLIWLGAKTLEQDQSLLADKEGD